MKRNASFKLTKKDKEAAKLAFLDSSQGVIRKDGSL